MADGGGVTPSVNVTRQSGAAFQKFITCAVLLPESFRGGCSFGASTKRALPRGIMCWPGMRRLTADTPVAGYNKEGVF